MLKNSFITVSITCILTMFLNSLGFMQLTPLFLLAHYQRQNIKYCSYFFLLCLFLPFLFSEQDINFKINHILSSTMLCLYSFFLYSWIPHWQKRSSIAVESFVLFLYICLIINCLGFSFFDHQALIQKINNFYPLVKIPKETKTIMFIFPFVTTLSWFLINFCLSHWGFKQILSRYYKAKLNLPPLIIPKLNHLRWLIVLSALGTFLNISPLLNQINICSLILFLFYYSWRGSFILKDLLKKLKKSSLFIGIFYTIMIILLMIVPPFIIVLMIIGAMEERWEITKRLELLIRK